MATAAGGQTAAQGAGARRPLRDQVRECQAEWFQEEIDVSIRAPWVAGEGRGKDMRLLHVHALQRQRSSMAQPGDGTPVNSLNCYCRRCTSNGRASSARSRFPCVLPCNSPGFATPDVSRQEASGGNPVSMALVGQMLMQGYGCSRNLEQGKRWVAKALETAEARPPGRGGGMVLHVKAPALASARWAAARAHASSCICPTRTPRSRGAWAAMPNRN